MADEKRKPTPRPLESEREASEKTVFVEDSKPLGVSDTLKPEPAPKPPDEGHGEHGQD